MDLHVKADGRLHAARSPLAAGGNLEGWMTPWGSGLGSGELARAASELDSLDSVDFHDALKITYTPDIHANPIPDYPVQCPVPSVRCPVFR